MSFNDGDINLYPFPLLGNEILINVFDTALPIPYVPIDETNVPAGWTVLGPIRDSQAPTFNIDLTSEEIVTGLTPTTQREVITGQTGIVEAFLQRFQPDLTQLVFNPGIANQNTAASSSSRALVDQWLGGTLGDKFALIVAGTPDINLVVDDGSSTYQQILHYTPRAQRTGQISLSERNKRAPEIPFRAKLIGYSNLAAPGRTVLLQLRWIKAA